MNFSRSVRLMTILHYEDTGAGYRETMTAVMIGDDSDAVSIIFAPFRRENVGIVVIS
jgi:hypothetical protein